MGNASIRYDVARGRKDLQQILDLQRANLPLTISEEELKKEGFVTAHHSLDLLTEMNESFPHIVARDGNEIVGYALVMLRSFSERLPVLVPMFRVIDSIKYKGKYLADSSYFVMGQVCIAKGYRGQGIFGALFEEMKQRMSPHFPQIITEISKRNQRSIRAHEKVGFKTIKEYWDEKANEDWVVVLWDWK